MSTVDKAVADNYSEFWSQRFPFPWDAQRLLAVWLRVAGNPKPVESDRDELALLLMLFVEMQFQNFRYIRSLPRVGVEALDAAQEIVTFIAARTERYVIPAVAEGGDEGRARVLLRQLITTIKRRVIDAVASINGKTKQRRTVTESRMPGTADRDSVLNTMPAAPPSIDATPLFELLRDRRTQELLLAGLDGSPGRSPRRSALIRLMRTQVATVIATGSPIPYGELDPDLQTLITSEDHACITTRIQRLVRRYSDDDLAEATRQRRAA